MIKIKRGLDIKLKGKAKCEVLSVDNLGLFALRPIDFPNIIKTEKIHFKTNPVK